jgi:hypothetical protein
LKTATILWPARLDERPQIPFLALAQLIVGRDATTVDGHFVPIQASAISCKNAAFTLQNALQPLNGADGAERALQRVFYFERRVGTGKLRKLKARARSPVY